MSSNKHSTVLRLLVVSAIPVFFFVGCESIPASRNQFNLVPSPTSEVPETREAAADAPKRDRKCERRSYEILGEPEEETEAFRRCMELQRKLNRAAWNGDIEQMKALISEGANPNAGYDQEGSPINNAVLNGQTEAVQFLLDEGAEANFVKKFGLTLLKESVVWGHPEVTKLLVSAGVDLCSNEPDDEGNRYTALDIARERKHQEIIKILEDAGADDCGR